MRVVLDRLDPTWCGMWAKLGREGWVLTPHWCSELELYGPVLQRVEGLQIDFFLLVNPSSYDTFQILFSAYCKVKSSFLFVAKLNLITDAV